MNDKEADVYYPKMCCVFPAAAFCPFFLAIIKDGGRPLSHTSIPTYIVVRGRRKSRKWSLCIVLLLRVCQALSNVVCTVHTTTTTTTTVVSHTKILESSLSACTTYYLVGWRLECQDASRARLCTTSSSVLQFESCDFLHFPFCIVWICSDPTGSSSKNAKNVMVAVFFKEKKLV